MGAGNVRFFLLICLIFCPFLAKSATEIRLTTGPDYPPLTDHSRADGGIATKLVLEIFRRMDMAPTLDWLPWARGYQSTKNGVYRATFPYYKSDLRESEFIYSDPLMSLPTFIWQRRGGALNLADQTSLAGKSLCVPLGFFSPMAERMTAMIARGLVRVEKPQTEDNCVQMLAAGRVDFAIGTEDQFNRSIDRNGLAEKLARSPEPLEIRPYFLIAPRNDPRSPQLIERFNAILSQMKEDGSYKRLTTK